MKAILTVEIPEHFDPRYCQIGGDGNIYYKRDGERASIIGNMNNLKLMPDRKEEGYPNDDYTISKADGWNACIIKEIENGTLNSN